MSDELQLAAALSAFGVLAFFGGLAAWLKRRRELKRLRSYVGSHAEGNAAGANRGLESSAIAVGLNRKIGHSSLAQQLQLQIVRSGLTIGPNQFLLGQVALGSVLFLVGRYLIFYSQGALALLLGLAMALPALVLPRFFLKHLERRRIAKFEGQLSQAVDVMAGALQAGSSLPQAFGLVSREMPNPIGEEFERLMQEASLAVPLDHALKNMLDRVPSVDLDMLVSAINIQYKVGGNLSHILKTIAHTIRERVRIRGELKTLTAQARLSSYIISGMPIVVVLALMVISPSYIMKLFDPGITRIMLISGCMGIVSGFYVMTRIAAIEV